MAHIVPFLNQICPFCGGTGIIAGERCPHCHGTGRFGTLGFTVPECHIFSTELFNLTDKAEYDGLTAQQKDYFRLLVSCIMIDLRTGSQMKTLLYSMFGLGTVTRTRIAAVIAEFEEPC